MLRLDMEISWFGSDEDIIEALRRIADELEAGEDGGNTSLGDWSVQEVEDIDEENSDSI